MGETPDPDLTAPANYRRILARFAQFYFVERWRIVAAFGAGFFSAAMLVAAPWPIKIMIDSVLLHGDSGFLAQAFSSLPTQTAIIILAFASMFIAILAALASAAEKVLNARLRETMTARLRRFTLENILARPLLDLQSYKSGEIALRLIDDTSQIARLYCKTAPIIFGHSITTIATLGAMFLINIWMGVIGLVILVLLSIFVRWAAPTLRAASRRKRQYEGAIASLAQEILRNLRFVKASNSERDISQSFLTRNLESLNAGVSETLRSVKLERLMKIVNGAALAIVVGGGALLVESDSLSVGELTICIAYLTQLLKPVEKINELASTVTKALVRAERLDAFVADERLTVITAPLAKNSTGAIAFKDVSFLYDENKGVVLSKTALNIAANETVWIEGASGAGKSTFIALLLRLFDPTAGYITLDGAPASMWSHADWRAQFSVMLQEHALFSGALRDSLLIGNQKITDEALWAALEKAGLGEFIRNLPRQLNAPIEEAGANFSGGQRSRLCLARALAADRPILVLDEPLANLDHDSREIVMDALRKERRQRTIIIISHERLPAAIIDKHLVLSAGKLSPAANAPCLQPRQALAL